MTEVSERVTDLVETAVQGYCKAIGEEPFEHDYEGMRGALAALLPVLADEIEKQLTRAYFDMARDAETPRGGALVAADLVRSLAEGLAS